MNTQPPSRRTAIRAKSLVAALEAFSKALPTEEECVRGRAAIDELIRFLERAKGAIGMVPTQDDVRSLRECLSKLSALFEQAVDSPVISAALGLEIPRPSRARIDPSSLDEPSPVTVEQFADMTIDQIRELLNDETQYTASRLSRLAKSLGARTTTRTGREAITNQILTKITTIRGYQHLSSMPGSSDDPSISPT